MTLRPKRVHIRFGHVAERLALEELQRRASLIWEETRADLLTYPDAIVLPQVQLEEHRVRVAEIAGVPVGFSAMLPHAGGLWEVDGLFVEPALWGKGVGRALMADAIERASLEGARKIEVTANPRAEGFYKKMGFAAVGPVATRFGPGLRMRYVHQRV
jgi:GNAT superfamily N-acetyltransferase